MDFETPTEKVNVSDMSATYKLADLIYICAVAKYIIENDSANVIERYMNVPQELLDTVYEHCTVYNYMKKNNLLGSKMFTKNYNRIDKGFYLLLNEMEDIYLTTSDELIDDKLYISYKRTPVVEKEDLRFAKQISELKNRIFERKYLMDFFGIDENQKRETFSFNTFEVYEKPDVIPRHTYVFGNKLFNWVYGNGQPFINTAVIRDLIYISEKLGKDARDDVRQPNISNEEMRKLLTNFFQGAGQRNNVIANYFESRENSQGLATKLFELITKYPLRDITKIRRERNETVNQIGAPDKYREDLDKVSRREQTMETFVRRLLGEI